MCKHLCVISTLFNLPDSRIVAPRTPYPFVNLFLRVINDHCGESYAIAPHPTPPPPQEQRENEDYRKEQLRSAVDAFDFGPAKLKHQASRFEHLSQGNDEVSTPQQLLAYILLADRPGFPPCLYSQGGQGYMPNCSFFFLCCLFVPASLRPFFNVNFVSFSSDFISDIIFF